MSKARPLTDLKRRENYARQNGHPYLTPRQRRRAMHKRNHVGAPFGKLAGR